MLQIQTSLQVNTLYISAPWQAYYGRQLRLLTKIVLAICRRTAQRKSKMKSWILRATKSPPVRRRTAFRQLTLLPFLFFEMFVRGLTTTTASTDVPTPSAEQTNVRGFRWWSEPPAVTVNNTAPPPVKVSKPHICSLIQCFPHSMSSVIELPVYLSTYIPSCLSTYLPVYSHNCLRKYIVSVGDVRERMIGWGGCCT